jgi:hypothetical protein
MKKNTIELPQPTAGIGGNTFLKVSDLPRKGNAKLTILGNARESTSQFGEGIELDVKLGNKTFTWTVQYSSVNYTRLYKRFAEDVNKWKGTVNVTRGEYAGKEYIKVVD